MIVFLAVVLGLALRGMSPEERIQNAHTLLRLARHWLARARDFITTTPSGCEDFYDAVRARTRWALVTPALVTAYVTVYVLMRWGTSGSPDEQLLISWGGSIGPRTTNGEWWRLATEMFVHRGWLHVIADAAGLVMAGALIERVIGPAAFALVYMASGLLAGVWDLSAHPVAVGAGAAGGIFGVYGLLLATLIWGWAQRSPLTIPLAALKRLWPGAVVFVAYNMATEGVLGESMQVGLVVGLTSGLILAARVSTHKPPVRRVCATMVATLGMAVIFAAPLRGIADVTGEMARVIALEKRTASAYETEVERFKKGRLTADALARVADGIASEVSATRVSVSALTGVPKEHQPLVVNASEYLRLREESWRLRVEGLRAGRLQTLQRAGIQESEALRAFEKVEKLKSGEVEK
jgi:rhomboid protease GluP